MATMTIEYNSQDKTAENLIKGLLFSGVFNIVENKPQIQPKTRRNFSCLAGIFSSESEISTEKYLARKRIDKKMEYGLK